MDAPRPTSDDDLPDAYPPKRLTGEVPDRKPTSELAADVRARAERGVWANSVEVLQLLDERDALVARITDLEAQLAVAAAVRRVEGE